MADQRTRHAEKRDGGVRNDRRVNTDPRTRTHGKQFFGKGRVFSTSSEDGSGLSSQTFLVIREAQESPDDNGTHCTCLSVSPLRKDLDFSECGVLHANSTSPPSIKGVKFKPLQVVVSRGVRFDAPMLVNYIKMFNVDTNSQVNDIGKLRPESLQDSMDNFKESLFDSPPMDKDGRNNKQGRRKGKSEEMSNKPPHGHRDQSKPHSKGQIAPNTRSGATNASGSGSGTVSNGAGTENTNKRPKLRNLEVPQHTKRQKPKGPSSYDSDGWEDGLNSPTRTRAAENKKLQDTRNHQRKPALPPVDQIRGTKDRHGKEMPAKRAEEEVLKGPSHADMPRSRGDERTGRPAITSQPHSPTKRNLNHRRDGEGVHKPSGVPGSTHLPVDDGSDRGRQREKNPGASRNMVPSRREDALRKKNDHLRKDDGQTANSGSHPQSTDTAVHDGKQGYGSEREDSDGVDGRRGHKARAPSSDTRRDLLPPTRRRDIPQNGTSLNGAPSDGNRDKTENIKNEHPIPGNDNIGRPSDIRAKPDPRSMATETSLPNKARPDEIPGRHRKGNPTTSSGKPGQAPNHRSQMTNNPAASSPRGRENTKSDTGDPQPMRSLGNNAPYREEPGRSNDNEQRSVSPRDFAQQGGSSRLSGGGTGGGVASRSPPHLPSRGGGLPPGRGPPSSGRGPSPNERETSGRDASPGRNPPPLDTPGSRSPGGDYSPTGSLSPMREESPVGGSRGSSSAMPDDHDSPRGSSGSLSPGNSMAGNSPGGSLGGFPEGPPNESKDSLQDSPLGSEMGSPIDSPVDSMAGGSPLDSTQEQSPIEDSSYRSPMGSEPPSPSMTERSRSLSPPPRGRSQPGEFSPGSASPRNPSPGGEPGQDTGGVRRRGPKSESGAQINEEQSSNQEVDNGEPYLNDDGCCGNGFFAWCKSVLDWFNGVGQEEWIQMDDQKDKGESRENSEASHGPDNEDSCSVAGGLDMGSSLSGKNPFGDGEDDDESTVVDDDGGDGGDDLNGDSDSDDGNGSDQEDSDDDTYSDSDVESNDEIEDEGESGDSSAASSRRSSTAVASELELDHQDSVRQSSDDNQTENTPQSNYPTHNQHIQTPQDTYSYAPNDDRSYMGQHNYPFQNTYTTNPNTNNIDIPPQELETAYPTTHFPKTSTNPSPQIPPNTAELATDNNDPHPPPYTHIPSTPHQLSRPRSTRFELASERDPVELDVPSIVPAMVTTRGKSELFLPPSLTPGLVTPNYGAFSSFSARTPRGLDPYYVNSSPPLPRSGSGTGTSSQNQDRVTPYHYQPQMQMQPALREPMNYPSSQMVPVDGSALVHFYPRAPKYDERNINAESGESESESDDDSDEDSDLDSGFGTYDDDLVGRRDEFDSAHYGGPACSSGLGSLPGSVDVSASTHSHTHTSASAGVPVRDGYYGKDNTPNVNANAYNGYTEYNHTPPPLKQYRRPPHPGFLSSASSASPAPSHSIYNTYHGQRGMEMPDKSGVEQVAGSRSKREGYGKNVRLPRLDGKAGEDTRGVWKGDGEERRERGGKGRIEKIDSL
ncbi:5d43880e-3273-4c5d-afc5-681692c02532 [Sclerotinia trifoliorum]|uniref:5d43880e-3273-4c5d-afc5-681692c02532 n=1 Tax=Sclerotinia trifoliorum TaxID=28548 RepID=A0A8H2W5C2_9HELO|nr:5d43880e-3273-4c5d-afc5-681692c02532 [Sclerotinia trifoliorum]